MLAAGQFCVEQCGTWVVRPAPKGPIPKRCPPCKARIKGAVTQEWRDRNRDHLADYDAACRAREKAARGTRLCPVCDHEFAPPRQRSTYCSPACQRATRDTSSLAQARAVHARREAARATADADPMCERCREVPRRQRGAQGASRFCSQRCMRAWHSAARRNIPSRRHGHANYEHKQRTAALGVVSAGVTWTQWRGILGFYGDRCAYCGSGDDIELDHVIPVARGGLHEPSNVVPACRSCNRSKRDQLLEEWRPGFVLARVAA